MHMKFANTFGLGEMTAAIVEILDILQLQISVILREKKKQNMIIYLNLSHVRAFTVLFSYGIDPTQRDSDWHGWVI